MSEFFKYFIVVLVGLGIDFGLLLFLTNIIGVWYFYAAAISFTIALVSNYYLATAFAFQYHSETKKIKEFTLFVSIGLTALILNQLCMFTLVDVMGVAVVTAKAFALPVTFTWNFALNKIVLFTDKQ